MNEQVPNLMSALYQWAYRQGENFATEALVWTLRTLLVHEPDEAIGLLSWLCFDRIGELKLPVTIGTQHTIDEGRPDISIQAPGVFIFVEVKTNSPLGLDQVDRYLAGLERQRMNRRGALVLLTRDAPELTSEQKNVVRCVRWHEIASRLRAVTITSAEAMAAIEMLTQFLKERVMTIEQVTWEFASGVTALRRLLVMLDAALSQAGIPKHAKANGWEFVGYYLDAKKYWSGIRYDAPHLLVFGYEDYDGTFSDAKWGADMVLDLSSEEVHFHSRDAAGQLERLTQFVREAYSAFKACDGGSQLSGPTVTS